MSDNETIQDGFNFLEKTINDELLRASAQNILDSYAHPWDILAESLQNAVDAVEMSSTVSSTQPRKIQISFNCQTRGIEVSDTGCGMSDSEIAEVLAPGKSLKRNISQLRGEKGVGISFLVFACNRFRLETCNGKKTVSLEIHDANNWIRGACSRQPTFSNVLVQGPMSHLGSNMYTRIWIENVPVRENDEEDMFQYTKPRLIHMLRSKTAVGHTHPLFSPGERPLIDIIIELQYVDSNGAKSSYEDVPYSYASPVAYLAKKDVITWDRYTKLLEAGRERKVKGGSLVRSGTYYSDTGKEVKWFAFASSRRVYDTISEECDLKTERGNDVEPGIYVSTKGMPTGIQLTPPRTGQAAYWPSLFILLEYDAINWDVGRKFVGGRVAEMLKRVALAEIFNKIVDHIPRFITGASSEVEGLEKERELDEIKQDVKETEDLGLATIFYAKVPRDEQGVIAIFHELLGAHLLKGYQTLRSSARQQYDAFVRYFVRRADLKGKAKDKLTKRESAEYDIFLEFKYEASALLADLEERKRARDIKLLVCWTLEEKKFESENIEVEEIDEKDSIYSGATHRLVFSNRYQFGADNLLHVICLKTLLKRLE